MTFREVFDRPGRVLSFELFPPKTDKGIVSLYRHVEKLVEYDPDFITCTYGAGGSTRDKTLEIVTHIKQRFDRIVAAHLTLVESTADQLRDFLARAQSAQIDAIVALRGDPPLGQSAFQKTTGGFRYANELVELIDAEFPQFGVAVAGYPETHREAPGPQADLDNLKRKVDAGADAIITQLFYDNDDFFRFRDRCQAAGIKKPILAGLLPITKLAQVQRLTQMCGSKLPAGLANRLHEQDSNDWHFQVGVEHATAQVDQLVAEQVDGIHFYVLNRSQAIVAIMSALKNEFQTVS